MRPNMYTLFTAITAFTIFLVDLTIPLVDMVAETNL